MPIYNFVLIILLILIVIILYLIPKRAKKPEHFLSKINSGRTIKYGDTVLLWSSRNAFIRKDPNDVVETGPILTAPETFNLLWGWEPYVIQDINGVGNSGPVSYSDSVRFQSWSKNWLGLDNNNKYIIGTTDQAKSIFQIMRFAPADATNNTSSTYVSYGDNISIKNSAGTYISCPQIVNGSSAQVVQTGIIDITAKISIVDKYGNGAVIDWAKRGISSESSDYPGHFSYNAIDGDINSISHTNSELNAWWQVKLPQNINIIKIKILNRLNCCQDRLADFDVLLLDDNGIITSSIYQKESLQSFVFDNINAVARTVKIMLRGTNYLHMAEVSVYGDNAEYSQLLEKPISINVISDKVIIDTATTPYKIIENADMPYIGKINSTTMSFMINFGTDADTKIITKSNAPNIYCEKKELICAIQTGHGNIPGIKTNIIKTGYIIEPKKWTHITIIIKSKIDVSTGWRYGLIAGAPYYLNSDLHQIYKTTPVKNLLVLPPTWDANIMTKYKLMGTTSATNSIMIIVNGMIQIEQVLEDMPMFNASPLVIGDPSTINPNLYIVPTQEGFANVSEETKKLIEEKQAEIKDKKDADNLRKRNAENMILAKKQMADSLRANAQLKSMKAITAPKKYVFMINQFKCYNYAISMNQLEHDYSYAHIIFNVFDGPNLPNVALSFEPNQLPTVIEEYSIAFWFLATKKSIIYSHDTRILGVDETSGMYYSDGKQKYVIDAILKEGIWYSYIESYADGATKIYINRQLKNELAVKPLPTFSHTRFNVKSQCYTLRYSNYAFDISEVLSINQTHPEHILRDSISKEWAQLGCPMKLSSDYLDLLGINKKSMDSANFSSLLREIKSSKDNKQVCYGDFTSNLLAECARNKDLINMNILSNDGVLPAGSEPTIKFDAAVSTAKLIEYNKKLTEENDMLSQEILAKKAGITIMTPVQKSEKLKSLAELRGMNISDEMSKLLDNMTEMVQKGHPLTELFDILQRLNAKDVQSNSLLYQKFKSKTNYFYDLQKATNFI